MNLKKIIAEIPAVPGVYLFKNKGGQILYVGKSINLKARLGYYGNLRQLGPKTGRMIKTADRVDWIPVESEIEALLLESKLIKKNQPPYNVRSKDDKSPIYIRITHEEFPRVLLARKNDWQKGDLLFGPFPSAKKVRGIWQFLRKIFPFCTCTKNRSRPCLYAYLGLCSPCPQEIIYQPEKLKKAQKKIYRQNITRLTLFLKGKNKNLIASLEKEMKLCSRQQRYEQAALLRNQIRSLAYLTRPFRLAGDYLKNPNLLADQHYQEINLLYLFLKKAGLEISRIPRRIEAFDISHLSGQEATGSMVTFLNGMPEKNLYRRFRIKKRGRADPVMMAEIIKRRLKHSDWGWPSLIVLDGGKPQLSAVSKSWPAGKKIPLIGLAKKKEEIIFLKSESFRTLRLSLDTPALKLLQRIRDEAHRFALNYHHLLRSKLID
ncbi:MAG: GIY-YIG nuclease family protein [Candidatus Pacebacteria bacterium]|nr:GIY-YIG nuclease family protein [Candidatus Paceibacterota bacterium]